MDRFSAVRQLYLGMLGISARSDSVMPRGSIQKSIMLIMVFGVQERRPCISHHKPGQAPRAAAESDHGPKRSCFMNSSTQLVSWDGILAKYHCQVVWPATITKKNSLPF